MCSMQTGSWLTNKHTRLSSFNKQMQVPWPTQLYINEHTKLCPSLCERQKLTPHQTFVTWKRFGLELRVGGMCRLHLCMMNFSVFECECSSVTLKKKKKKNLSYSGSSHFLNCFLTTLILWLCVTVDKNNTKHIQWKTFCKIKKSNILNILFSDSKKKSFELEVEDPWQLWQRFCSYSPLTRILRVSE